MKKVKLNVKILAGAAIATTVITAGHMYTTNAMNKRNLTSDSIQLNVEKQDRDTIKIFLSNFSDLAKSLQLSVKIEDGNVKFVEDTINWLVDNSGDSLIADYKIDSSKKILDLFLVSKDPINSDGGVIELCEIDVSKDESIIENLFKSNDGSYKVVPNVVNSEAYSYVRYSTNKRIGGENIVNSNENKLTINDDPIIKLKENPYIMDNNIVILKGTVFNISDYVEAFDADGNEIKDIQYSGKVDNKKAGSYNIICTATDSLGDTTTLKTTVIVEDFTNANITKPVIYGTEDSIEIVIGENFNLEEGIKAVDYMGRSLPLIISGDYDTDIPGKYTLVYTAKDRFGNTVTAERILIVSEKSSEPDNGGDNPGDDSNDDSSNGSGGSSGNDIIDQLKDIIDTSIIKPVSGTGTVSSPLLVEPEDASSDKFVEFMSKISRFNIESGTVKEDENYKVVSLKLSSKSGNVKSIDNNNSECVYLSIRVEKTKTEFMNILNSFIEQNGLVNSDNTGGSDDTGNSGGSNGSGDSGNPGDSNNSGGSNGSGGSNSSNNMKYEIPSKLEGIINSDIIKPVDGNGTAKSPLKVEVKNVSASEFRSFINKLDKFNIEIDSVEENDEYKIVNVKLTEKYSMFNIMRFLRSSEDTYLSIKVDKYDNSLLSVINDFIANNSSDNSEEENGGISGEIQKPSHGTESDNQTDKEDTSNDSYFDISNNNSTTLNNSSNDEITENSSNDVSNSSTSENSSDDVDNDSDILSEDEINDDEDNNENTVDFENEEDAIHNDESVIAESETKKATRKKIAGITIISIIASGVLTSILYYKIKKK